jgi:hypothetical protein
MRGADNQQDGMFSCVSPEKRVPADHPLRPVRRMVDDTYILPIQISFLTRQ